MANYTIAILGRPNVGKSTLFNRLIGSTHSIVSPIEGVTRDRVYGKFEWSGREYNLIDTGGYLPDTMDKINSNVRLQADIATDEADLLLLLVDGRTEITSSEKVLTSIITKTNKPYLLDFSCIFLYLLLLYFPIFSYIFCCCQAKLRWIARLHVAMVSFGGSCCSSAGPRSSGVVE